MRRLTAAAALLASVAVHGATPVVRPAPPPPPYAGAYQPQGVDEIGLWKEIDEEERALASSPLIIRDPALNAYVRSVLCETVGEDRCRSTRIYLVRSPIANADMSPNGMMRVYSGLFLRLRDEAEFAAVLGHEFGHYESRHTLDHFKARRTSGDLLSWAAIAASLSGTYDARRNYGSLERSVYGGLFRYQRDQERQADTIAMGYLNASPLRPQAAAHFWQTVMGEATASARARGLRKPNFAAASFLDTHPPDAEREATFAAFASPEGAGRDTGADRYAKALAPWLPQFLDDQIKLNDFGGSDYLIASLAERGWTAPLLLARGDLYRARGNPRDLVNAADFYARAVALDPGLAEAQRGLGLALIKTGSVADGRAALGRYLALKPDAGDAAMIGLLARKDVP